MKSELIASMEITLLRRKHSLEVKFCVNEEKLIQISYGYLLLGKIRELEKFEIVFPLLKGDTLIDIGTNAGL